jgi:hypothetical protein
MNDEAMTCFGPQRPKKTSCKKSVEEFQKGFETWGKRTQFGNRSYFTIRQPKLFIKLSVVS